MTHILTDRQRTFLNLLLTADMVGVFLNESDGEVELVQNVLMDEYYDSHQKSLLNGIIEYYKFNFHDNLYASHSARSWMKIHYKGFIPK